MKKAAFSLLLLLCIASGLAILPTTASAHALHHQDIVSNATSYDGPTVTYCPGALTTVLPNSSNISDILSFVGTDNHINIESLYSPYVHLVLNETSPKRASLTCFNGLVYMAWRANDSSNAIHVGYVACSWGGCSPNAANGVTLPGQSTFNAPSLAAYNGKLYVTWRGATNNNIYIMESQDGVHWYNGVAINDTTIDTPTLAVYQNHLYIVWAGTDNPHHIWFGTYSDGNENLSNHTCICTQYTYNAIGVDVYNNTLNFAWDGATNTNVYTGAWSPAMGFQSNGVHWGISSSQPPSIDGGNNLLLWTGEDYIVNTINLYS